MPLEDGPLLMMDVGAGETSVGAILLVPWLRQKTEVLTYYPNLFPGFLD